MLLRSIYIYAYILFYKYTFLIHFVLKIFIIVLLHLLELFFKYILFIYYMYIMLWKRNNRRTKEINEKVNRTQDFTWFGQLCLRPRSCRDFTILENITKYYMFRWLLNLLYHKIRLSPKT